MPVTLEEYYLIILPWFFCTILLDPRKGDEFLMPVKYGTTLMCVAALEQHFYRTDPDCQAARIPLPEFDLYISTVLPLENKGIL